MSREIKFRGINTAFRGGIEIDHVCVIDWLHDEVYFENGTDVTTSIEDAKLMQYTGLKDKNGVEIYEGDIVLCLYYSSQDRDTRIVEYDKQLGFIPMQEPIDYDEVYASGEHWEVIGNIHQNPELFK